MARNPLATSEDRGTVAEYVEPPETILAEFDGTKNDTAKFEDRRFQIKSCFAPLKFFTPKQDDHCGRHDTSMLGLRRLTRFLCALTLVILSVGLLCVRMVQVHSHCGSGILAQE